MELSNVIDFPRVSSLFCRTAFVIIGVGGFVVSKQSIDQKRYENMKIRERMKKSNDGEYQIPSRFEQQK